jgi:hypothetical protein
MDYARRVGLDLVRFMQSYPAQMVNGGGSCLTARFGREGRQLGGAGGEAPGATGWT